MVFYTERLIYKYILSFDARKEKEMGLFGPKSTCPVCGAASGGLGCITIKNNEILCKKCSSKMSVGRDMPQFMSAEDVKEHLAYREQNKMLWQTYKESNRVATIKSYVLSYDMDHKLWKYGPSGEKENPALFRFDEITGGELVEGSGRTASFGKVPEMSTVKENKLGSNMAVRVYTSNRYHPEVTVNIIPGGKLVIPGSMEQQIYRHKGNGIITVFKEFYDQCDHSTDSAEPEKPAVHITKDEAFEEIRKYKALLDEGIITEEEFAAKKKELLGL